MMKRNYLNLLVVSFLLLLLFCFGCADLDLPLDAAVKAENGELEESNLALFISKKSGYISVLGNDGNIYTLNHAGDDLSVITEDASGILPASSDKDIDATTYLIPTWSTSGQKLAYGRFHQSSSTQKDIAQNGYLMPIKHQLQESIPKQITYSIISVNRDGLDSKELWSGTARPIYLYWSPDQVQLTALLQEGASPSLRLVLLNANDQSVKYLDVGAPLFWDWSPNGKQILTHIGSPSADERIALLDFDSDVTEEIFNLNSSFFMSPDLSPAGDQFAIPIAADNEDDDDTWLAIYSLESQKRSVIDRLDGEVRINPSFSPDGKKIAYLSAKVANNQNKGELAIYNLQTGELVITKSKNITAFFWSPDSQKIAWVSDLGPLKSQEKGGSKSLIVFDTQTEIETEVVAGFETSSQFNEVLTFYSQYQRSATIWSPDSQRLVLPVQHSSKSEIKVIHISGMVQPRTIAEGTLAFWSAE